MLRPCARGARCQPLPRPTTDFYMYSSFVEPGRDPRRLIAELIGGEIARTLGFKMPELVFVNLDEAFGRTEADEEIQDLLKFSVGLNLALHYLQGAITFDPTVTVVESKLASQIVWLDALLTNVDRTARNTNMLMWHKELWLIDHGAALYFHHSMDNWEEQVPAPLCADKRPCAAAQSLRAGTGGCRL
jgi:hypothetical protein